MDLERGNRRPPWRALWILRGGIEPGALLARRVSARRGGSGVLASPKPRGGRLPPVCGERVTGDKVGGKLDALCESCYFGAQYAADFSGLNHFTVWEFYETHTLGILQILFVFCSDGCRLFCEHRGSPSWEYGF